MTSERDIERLLDHWLAERPTQVADRVLDEVADQIARQPQQPAWLVLWRDSHVNSNLKPLLAVAAIVVIAVVGFAVLRPSSGSNVGGAATSSPAPSPSLLPSASPSANAVFPSWFTGERSGAGILPAGGQTTRVFEGGVTFTVPEGWVNHQDDAAGYELFPDSPANEAEYASNQRYAERVDLWRDATNWLICEPIRPQGSTAAELVDSLLANEALTTSEPVDVSIGGLPGRQIDFQLDPAWTGSCPAASEAPPTYDLRDGRIRTIFLDHPDDGSLWIVVDSLYSAGHEAFLAEAMPIVESFQFDATP
jgi:hypothetical protein